MTSSTRLVRIDFASTNYRRIEAVRLSVIAAAVVLVCSLAALTALSVKYRAAAAAMERQVVELSTANEKLLPAMQERQQLVRNLAEMSSLIDARRFGWSGLLTALEAVFPSGAALNRLEFAQKDRTIALEGFATSPEALSSLMIGLQRSEMFRNPQLKRQSMEKGVLSFNVTVNYQEHAAASAVAAAVRGPRR